MDKTMAGLLGVVGALAVGAQAQAALPEGSAAQILEAASYADLLRPIPNALETLQALDAPQTRVEDVQYYPYYYAPPPPYYRRLYHHHHHRYYRRYYHHHNFHHHNGYDRFRR